MFRPITLMLTLLVLALVRPALADECTSPVFDTTGKINASEIEPLLKKIAGDGADPALVRVITTAEMNKHGNLDKYAGDMLGRCPAWQSAGGRLKSNIFLLILEPNGKVAVQFAKKGPFQNVLTHNKIVDIGEEMGGLISKGDLTGAAKAGLIRTHTLLSTTKANAIVSSGPVTIVNHNEKPADLSGGFSFLKWLLLAGVIGALVWLFVRYQVARSKRNAAQQVAQNTRGACNNLITGFEGHLTTIGVLLAPLKSTINAVEFSALQDQLQALKSSMDSAKSQYVSMIGSANDPESVGLSADAYEAMTATFERVQANLERVDAEAIRLSNSIRGISRLRDSAQPTIDALAREIEIATNNVNAETSLKVNGPRSVLQQAISSFERAQKDLEDKSYQAVADTCKEGTVLARKAAQQVHDLASRKQRIEGDITRLEQYVIADKLVTLDSLINQIKTTFGEGSETPALEQRTVVIQRTQTRQSAIILAKSAANIQDWDSAEQQIAITRSAESDINNAINTVQNMSRRLADARRPQTSSYRPSSGHSSGGSSRSTSHVSNTTVNNYGRDDSGLGLGLGLGLALNSLEVSEENRELRRELDEDRRYGRRESRRSYDDDDDNRRGGFGGESLQTSSNDDDGGGFGGESVDTSSSSSDSDFSSNDSSSSDD